MATPSSVPLHCSICPKKPTFSDISHLLTHVASKGHLSHYYKTKIRSASEQQARTLIDTYDLWYDDNNIEELMAERLSMKTQRNDTGRASKRRAAGPKAAAKSGRAPAPLPMAPPPMPLPLQMPPDPFAYDPRLQATYTSYATPSLSHNEITQPSIFDEPMSSANPRTYKPRLHLWPTSRPTAADAIPLDPSSPLANATAAHVAPFAPMHTRSMSTSTSNLGIDEDDEAYCEATRLKGILWPGMDLFDAATNDMKRRRNQKKAMSVATQLEHDTLDVDPTEMIWRSLGVLYKARPITGKVDFDSSPYKIDPVSPEVFVKPARKKPAPRAAKTVRAPLAEKDPNISLRRGKQVTITPAAAEMMAIDNNKPAAKSPKKRKRKIAVLDEQQQPEEQPFGNPTGMRYLTSEFQYNPPVRQQQQQQQQLVQHQVHQQHVLDNNYAAYYQPALQQSYFHQGYNAMPQAVYGVQYYGPYNPTAFDLPGFFSYPPQQQHQQVVIEDLGTQDTVDDENTVDPWDVKVLTGEESQQTTSQEE